MKNNHNRMVIKQGSSFFDRKLYHRKEAIGEMANQIKTLKNQGNSIAIVHSGAVVEGKRRFEQVNVSTDNVSPNVLAAMGSAGISENIWLELMIRKMFSAPMLVTHSEMNNQKHLESILTTMEAMEKSDVIPLINANDALELEELRKLPEGGDNDQLAAEIAGHWGAHTLLLCTDVDGFMVNGEVQKQVSVSDIDSLQEHIYEPSKNGTGSMHSKLQAAAYAARMGINAVIGHAEADYQQIINNQIGTQVVQ